MLSEEEFIQRNIFHQDTLPKLRKAYPEQVKQFAEWYCNENWKHASDRRKKFRFKLTELQKRGNIIDITPELLWRLYAWYQEQVKECHYCGLAEAQMKPLHSTPGFINKRKATRGFSLEIERKQSDLPYERIDNLALACYWCNNAKTDTFTEEEFKPVGEVFRAIWQARLAVFQ